MKNSKKNAATTKKDYQAALMKKAAKKANATSVVDPVNTDNISITADTAPMRKVNGKHFSMHWHTFCQTIRQLKPRGNQILRTFSTCY